MAWRLLYGPPGAGVKRSPGAPRPVATEAGEDALAVVVERQADARHHGDEDDGGDVALLAHVGAEVRADPRPRDAAEGGDDREEPEGHRADAEQVRDDVLRKSRDRVEDQADDGAFRLEDEVHPLPVVLAQPGADQRLAPHAA